MAELHIRKAGPGLTVQDLGRAGWKAQGLSTGGAADPRALIEAAALLGLDSPVAAIEMMGFGGTFVTKQTMRFCLTGAIMDASIDGEPVMHNTTRILTRGATLQIGGARKGVYGYLTFAGGIKTEPVMGSRAAHLTAGIGRLLADGDVLPLGVDPDLMRAPQKLALDDRYSGGMIRVMAGPQTDHFDHATIDSFVQTHFQRSARGNRQGIRLSHDGPFAFENTGGLSLVSDLIVPGDIQITGAGVPYILLAECQTIGGYPRIGTVIPQDLPKVAQAAPGMPLRFQFLTLDEADATAVSIKGQQQKITQMCQPMVRDPHDIADLLRYQLISGATPGDDLERP